MIISTLIIQWTQFYFNSLDPAYTSIGMLKYAPQFMVTKDIAAAYVVARRGAWVK